VLLRPGGIGVDALTRVLGRKPQMPGADAPRASGTLPAHYAPRTPTLVIAPDLLRAELAQHLARDERVAVLARTLTAPDGFDAPWIAAPRDAAGYAHDLYANLRALDAANADLIAIEAPPGDDAWLAVRDRISRAAHGEDDDRD